MTITINALASRAKQDAIYKAQKSGEPIKICLDNIGGTNHQKIEILVGILEINQVKEQ